MTKRYWLPVQSGLLSHSAMSIFQECPRKYAWKYIDKPDIEEVVSEGRKRGRTFHELVENNDWKVANELTEHSRALVVAGAVRYMEARERGEFPKVTHREQKMVNEEKQFIGYLDEMTIDEEHGLWMIGEIKTGAKFDPIDYALAETKHQTALYQGMAKPFCSENWLSVNDFAGLAFKKVIFPNIKPLKGRATKTKPAEPETIEAYFKRAYDQTLVLHKIIKTREEIVQHAMHAFEYTLQSIDHLGADSERYPRRCDACLHPYFGVCTYLKLCVGLDLSEKDDVDVVSSDLDFEDTPT